MCHPDWMDKGGKEGVLPAKQTAVSHDYIVSIAPCLDGSPSSSHLRHSTLQISAGAAESELKLSELPTLTAPDGGGAAVKVFIIN